ncbi:hypothetical protein INT45_007117 [Circinella minor]|uniref:Uncharacterized protein n=1 Tax=Circinella minor TaxID=1195481 RepID=A0A8H7SCA3_9FUNG|nr:hypothetical protein INT45_007117 [Circinella minor]
MYSLESSDKSGRMESSFTLDAIYPIFIPFLQESTFITRKGTDGQAVGSNVRRSKSPEEDKKIGRFVDLSMIYDYGDCPRRGLIVVEIKPPMKMLDGSRPDSVKIANEMKDSIDKMVKDGYDDDEITILGVLVEGMRTEY